MNTTKTAKYVLTILLGIVVFFAVLKLVQNNADSELDDVTVILTAKVLEDDMLQLFYWEKIEKEFKTENSVSTKIKGSKQFQEITFTLPKLTEIYRFRLDIGENPKQQKIQIQKIQFHSDVSDNEFGLVEFNQLFAPNNHIKIAGEGEY